MIEQTVFSLQGKKILVTGASSGIGRAVARSCVQMGAYVFLTARNHNRLMESVADLEKSSYQIIAADLTDDSSVLNMMEALPALDGVVHCAGIGHRKVCKYITEDDIDSVMNINFKATVLLQTQLLQQRKIRKSASIVFIASRAAESPSIGNAIYSASKGAMMSYARCLALEMAPRAVRVNCICPAMIWTELIFQEGITKEDLEIAEQSYPLKRYGKPDDVANLAIYMLADASSWMTGNCVDLTGGSL